MEKTQIHKGNRKDRSFLTAFSDSQEYNHPILHQNWTDISFIKVRCNVESEIISMNFSYDVTWKSTGLTYTSNGPFTHEWLCNILHWSLGKHCSLSHTIFQMLTLSLYHILKHTHSHSLISSEAFHVWEAVQLWAADTHFPKLPFSLGNSMVRNVVTCPGSDRLTALICKKLSSKYRIVKSE